MAAAPDFPFDPDLLRHVSPIEWKNVVLYGEIKIDPAKLTRRRSGAGNRHAGFGERGEETCPRGSD